MSDYNEFKTVGQLETFGRCVALRCALDHFVCVSGRGVYEAFVLAYHVCLRFNVVLHGTAWVLLWRRRQGHIRARKRSDGLLNFGNGLYFV